MMKQAAVLLLALAFGGPVAGQGIGLAVQGQRDLLVSFDGGIGVIPVSNVAGTANLDGTFPNVTRNIVRGVNPAPGNWRIADLKATIDIFGRIKVKGRGLILAGGNNIGLNGNQSVFATLICEAALPFVEHSTGTPVPLDPNGDFRIEDTLNPMPSGCDSPVLLIRSASGSWLAAGILKFGDN